jgi:hypothetical protein
VRRDEPSSGQPHDIGADTDSGMVLYSRVPPCHQIRNLRIHTVDQLHFVVSRSTHVRLETLCLR